MSKSADAGAFEGPPPGPEEPEDASGRSLGEFLRQERLNRNLTLEELARAARVPVHYLEALEGEEFDGLPPKIYVRGFLEAIAARFAVPGPLVQLRYDEALREHKRQRKDEGAIFALFLPEGERFHWRDWAIPLFLVLAAALLLTGRWLFEKEDGRGVAGAPAGRVEERAAAPLVEPGPADVAGGGEKAAMVSPSLPAAVTVVLRAEGATWLSAERDGAALEEWTMKAGETRELRAAGRIVLSLGNAGAVRIEYNGMEMGFIGGKGEVRKGLLFTPR